ncbi:hypothetical protein [Bacillus sp. B1-b2]|uniref:hypothetical protein n=1 Tax=Bacillus sp. B1-b2 TaxID=2653201 RepID=UPI00186A3290|nr:hypothetical protein [Bacillus sp. B1-b2]
MNSEKFEELSDLIYSRYFVYDSFSSNPKKGYNYLIFNNYIKALDETQVKKLNTNYLSYSAKKQVNRIKGINKETLANVDTMLYY